MHLGRCVLSVALLLPVAAGAQRAAPRDTSADAAARAYFAALTEARWIDAARLLVLAPVDSQRAGLLEAARDLGIRRPRVPEDFFGTDSTMPREVAEWFAKQADRYEHVEDDFVSAVFANVRDTTELARLSLLEAAARWLEARDPRYHHLRSMAMCGDVAVLPDSIRRALQPRYEVMGLVHRPDTAWVMHRDTSSTGNAMVIVLGAQTSLMLRVAGEWRMRPPEVPTHFNIAYTCQGSSPRDAGAFRDTSGVRRPR